MLSLTIFLSYTHCSKTISVPVVGTLNERTFLSEYYNHFEGGVLFTDVEFGLSVLWNASFKNGRVYKENLGYIVPAGLLILPNADNTRRSSRLDATLYTDERKLYTKCLGFTMQVLAIVHTHPDKTGLSEPAPENDYQYAFIGLHNYVISTYDLYDAFYNSRGEEKFVRLGPNKSFSKISGYHTMLIANRVSSDK